MWGIDAKSIPKDLARWSNIVWLQYPYIRQNSMSDLILGCLESAGDNCSPGTYVCAGITTLDDDIGDILGVNLDSCTLDQYEFLGVDDVLIKKLLSYGYKHQGETRYLSPVDNLHERIKDHHATLVFRIKDDVQNSYTRMCSELKEKHH